ncbi:hypothetical protein BCV70DRAFT_198672 [Testicularia cyperi]|uniref:DNA damage-binding protein 1 n=1 Tax=Testicularia cyperi TaxID=1882483 RepID=A0A317XWB4_9BASI|nr:hypothetical protein BCV70DRAFT_198672 [Testicularia cyperi]
MLYVAHAHQATAQLQSLVLPFFFPGAPCLAVVKHSSISFLSLPPTTAAATTSHSAAHKTGTLDEIQSLDLNARILSVEAVTLPAQSSATPVQILLVLTDHHRPHLIALAASVPASRDGDFRISTLGALPLEEAARSPAESSLGLWVEPVTDSLAASVPALVGQRFALCHTYKGIMRVVPLQSQPRLSSAAQSDDAEDVQMEDAAAPPSLPSAAQAANRFLNLSQSFGVRLPHPNLLSCTPLMAQSSNSNPAVALLSLSSLPSRIPGLGEQCLPVLSFHTVDVAGQDLLPLPWGPPRKPPRSEVEDTTDAEGTGERRNSDTSQSRDTRKQRGLSAMGQDLDANALRKREESWARSELAQAHVPLPVTDALGAHLLHALPVQVGGGVLVFSERSILYVPPPRTDAGREAGAASASTSSTAAKGKRRKASMSGGGGGAAESRRLSSGASQQASTSAAVEGASPKKADAVNSSNENGKRRRSSAAATAIDDPVTSPRASMSAGTAHRPRLLRASLPYPMQTIAAVSIPESSSTGDGTFTVLFGTSSGHLNALQIHPATGLDSQSASASHPRSMRVEQLGEISQPAGPQALTYLGDNLVQVSSATGDTGLYRIEAPASAEQALQDAAVDEQMVTPPSSPTQARKPSALLSSVAELPVGGRLVQLKTWANLGPIVDFVIDGGGCGDDAAAKTEQTASSLTTTSQSAAQARIVTCSGSGPNGSIRVVRNGVAINELSSIAVPSVHRVWPIHQGTGFSRITSALVVTYSTATSLLVFGPDGGLVDASAGFTAIGVNPQLPTLTADSIETAVTDSATEATLFVVNKEKVVVAQLDSTSASLAASDHWTPEKGVEITAAASNDRGQLVLSLSDRSLCSFTLGAGKLELQRTIALDQEVSCLDVSPLTSEGPAHYVACGFWQSRSIQIFALPELQPVAQQSVASQAMASVPRSILLHRFGTARIDSVAKDGSSDTGHAHLLVGLGDGTLVSYGLSLPDTDSYSPTVGLFDGKTVSLGTRALHLDAIETSHGARAVAVAGSRPTIVYADAKRFSYSSVKYSDVRGVATLRSGAGHGYSLFALSDSLQVASIGALQRQDITSKPLGLDQPLSIAHWPERGVFAVCTWAFLPRGSETRRDRARGSIKVLDSHGLQVLHDIALLADERPNCIELVELADRKLLVVGTGFVAPDALETTEGRLLGFDVALGPTAAGLQAQMQTRRSTAVAGERGELRQVFERRVSGNVYSLQGLQNRLVAAVNSEVMVYTGVPAAAAAAAAGGDIALLRLKQQGSWACSFIASNLSVVEPETVVVGDALRSMNVLRVDAATGRVTEIGRDCDPFWTTATELLDSATQTYIGADISFNLYTTQRVPLSETLKKRIRKAKDQDLESGASSSRRNLPTSNHLAGGSSANADNSNNDKNNNNNEIEYAHIMQRQAVWHYGDMINKFVRGSLVPSGAGEVKVADPRLVFCTAGGAIGVIATVEPEASHALSQLERNINLLIESASGASASACVVGGVEPTISAQDWRTLRTDHRVQPPTGVIDADRLQLFINGKLDKRHKSAVLDGPVSTARRIRIPDATLTMWIEELGQLS